MRGTHEKGSEAVVILWNFASIDVPFRSYASTSSAFGIWNSKTGGGGGGSSSSRAQASVSFGLLQVQEIRCVGGSSYSGPSFFFRELGEKGIYVFSCAVLPRKSIRKNCRVVSS